MDYKKVITNKPNWLCSEVGLTLKSCTIPADFATTVTENGRTIVESGTIFEDANTGQEGLVFGDYDITDGTVIGSIMVAGRYYDNKLPATAIAKFADFQAQGLFECTESAVVRPNFGVGGVLPVPNFDSIEIDIDGVQDPLVFTTNVLETEVSTTVTEVRINLNTEVELVGSPILYSNWNDEWIEYGDIAINESDSSVLVITIKDGMDTAPATPTIIPLKILANSFINKSFTPNIEITATLNIVDAK